MDKLTLWTKMIDLCYENLLFVNPHDHFSFRFLPYRTFDIGALLELCIRLNLQLRVTRALQIYSEEILKSVNNYFSLLLISITTFCTSVF